MESFEDHESINIMFDARHGSRINAKDSSIVTIRNNTHKVLYCQHVTKTDDQVHKDITS